MTSMCRKLRHKYMWINEKRSHLLTNVWYFDGNYCASYHHRVIHYAKCIGTFFFQYQREITQLSINNELWRHLRYIMAKFILNSIWNLTEIFQTSSKRLWTENFLIFFFTVGLNNNVDAGNIYCKYSIDAQLCRSVSKFTDQY
jgi:hypothetical protein